VHKSAQNARKICGTLSGAVRISPPRKQRGPGTYSPGWWAAVIRWIACVDVNRAQLDFELGTNRKRRVRIVRSGALLPPSPPAEKATTSQDQAGKASTGDGTGDRLGRERT
jgi:hypothetical protein